MIEDIQHKRIAIFNSYYSNLSELQESGKAQLPLYPSYATRNGHLFYLLTGNQEERDRLISDLNKKGFQSVFHYLPLHSSVYYTGKHDGRKLPNADRYASCLIRLPFFYNLTENEIDTISRSIIDFYIS